MKPEPYRLRIETYPFRADIPTRYGDVDMQQHLNNVAIAGLYQEARMMFIDQATGRRARDEFRAMVVQQTLRYLAEAEYPEPVEIACGVSRIGTSSYDIVQALFQRGRCVGLCDAVLVNTGLNGAEPLPLRLREAFDRALIAETAD